MSQSVPIWLPFLAILAGTDGRLWQSECWTRSAALGEGSAQRGATSSRLIYIHLLRPKSGLNMEFGEHIETFGYIWIILDYFWIYLCYVRLLMFFLMFYWVRSSSSEASVSPEASRAPAVLAFASGRDVRWFMWPPSTLRPGGRHRDGFGRRH